MRKIPENRKQMHECVCVCTGCLACGSWYVWMVLQSPPPPLALVYLFKTGQEMAGVRQEQKRGGIPPRLPVSPRVDYTHEWSAPHRPIHISCSTSPPHPLGLGDPGQGYVEGPDQAIPTLEEGFIHGREGKGRRCCLGDSIY